MKNTSRKKYCVASMGEEDVLIVVNLDNLRPALKRVRGLVALCKDDPPFLSVEISFNQFDTWRPFVFGEDAEVWSEWLDLTPDQQVLLETAEEDDRVRKQFGTLKGFEACAHIAFFDKYSGELCESAAIPWEWCNE